MRNLLLLLSVMVFSACTTDTANQVRLRVRVDGNELVLAAEAPISVAQVLQRERITLGPFDRLNPPDFTPVTDGLLVTIVRVENRVECAEEPVPYQSETLKTPDLPVGETRVLQAGANGTARVCYDVLLEDGVEKSRTQSSRTLLAPPKSQVMAVGVDTSRIEPINFGGTITYISNGQARYIRDTSANQGLLPTGGNLDGLVFALSPDGRRLLYTRKPETPSADIFNELWVLMDVTNPDAQPVKLIIENVLSADWLPRQTLTFTYSTLRPRPEPPGYQALNDLFRIELDSSGKITQADSLLTPNPGNQFSQWGTEFVWSPDGTQLAWAQAEGVGLVDLEGGIFERLLDFRIYQTTLARGWLWLPSLAWSSDGRVLAASVHGAPLGDEQPENSPVFDVAVISLNPDFIINPMFERVGMWAAPQYSSLRGEDDLREGYIAYLQARTPNDSVNGEYDLVIADRDGSNPRVVFPGKDRAGIIPFEDRSRGAKFIWSPDGWQILLSYQGDLHIISVESGRATRITVEGSATSPRWVR